MASQTYGRLLRGLWDVKITNLAGTLQEDLFGAQGLSITLTYAEAVQRGDDIEIGSIANISGATGTFSAGAYSNAAVAIMAGKTVTVAGSSPNETATLQWNAGDQMPYFKLYARINDDNAGDLHVYLGKAKLSGGPSFEFADESFWSPSFDIRIFDDGSNGLVKLVQHETRTTLPTS